MLPIKCIMSGGVRTFMQAGLWESAEATAEAHCYYSDLCLSGVSWGWGAEADGNVGSMKYPMSATRLFLKGRPQTTLQLPMSPRIRKVPTPTKASRIPGVLE